MPLIGQKTKRPLGPSLVPSGRQPMMLLQKGPLQERAPKPRPHRRQERRQKFLTVRGDHFLLPTADQRQIFTPLVDIERRGMYNLKGRVAVGTTVEACTCRGTRLGIRSTCRWYLLCSGEAPFLPWLPRGVREPQELVRCMPAFQTVSIQVLNDNLLHKQKSPLPSAQPSNTTVPPARRELTLPIWNFKASLNHADGA